MRELAKETGHTPYRTWFYKGFSLFGHSPPYMDTTLIV